MTLTLLSIFMLPICLALVLSPKRMHAVVKDWAGSPGIQFLSSVFLLFFALILVISTGFNLKFWEGSWNSQIIISWLAVLTAIKGAAQFFPQVVEWRSRTMTEARMPMFGFLGLLLCLGFVYLETQVF